MLGGQDIPATLFSNGTKILVAFGDSINLTPDNPRSVQVALICNGRRSMNPLIDEQGPGAKRAEKGFRVTCSPRTSGRELVG
jgi:hypothetical protein